MDDALRAELLRRIEPDRAARLADDPEAVWRVDAENLPWIKHVIATYGWPGKSLVGEDGANAAWLLVQHADADPAFQRHCLDLMTAAVSDAEASPGQLALLTDRVLLAEGQQQLYGSQLRAQGGTWRPRDLACPEQVDERRAAVGLEPLAQYLQRFDDVSTLGLLKCPKCGAWVPVEPQEDGVPITFTCDACGTESTIGRAG